MPYAPKNIYYTGEIQGCIFKQYEKKVDLLEYDFDDNDLDNEEGSLWHFEKKKENKSVDNDNDDSNIETSNNDKDEVTKLIADLKSLVSKLEIEIPKANKNGDKSNETKSSL